MNAMLWTAVGAAAGCAAVTGHLATAWLLQATPSDARRPPPTLLRPVWPLARRLGASLAPRLPSALAVRIDGRLRAADVDGGVTSAEWCAASLIHGTLAAAIAALVAATSGLSSTVAALAGALVGIASTELHLRGRIAARDAQVRRELPLYLDVLALAVESGASLTTAVALAADKAPEGPLRRAFLKFLAESRAGRPRVDALHALAAHVPSPGVESLVGALVHSEATGARLGPTLRAQAVERTNERFARAEKLAMQAPVRMLGPLILCIFPCTFVVLGFPIVTKLMAGF